MSDNSSNSVGARYEEERTRANLQSQISNLQNQIDELRRLLRSAKSNIATTKSKTSWHAKTPSSNRRSKASDVI